MSTSCYSTQNELLLGTLKEFYKNNDNMTKMMNIITGESKISLRIVDWFTTNYAKKYFTVYTIKHERRFKVYHDYKLKLKAYSKKRFDPFCRWERIHIPYKEDHMIQTTIGQLNFFKWALENKIIEYIHEHLKEIEEDMNTRNSSSRKNKKLNKIIKTNDQSQTHEQNQDQSKYQLQHIDLNKSQSDTESNFSETTDNSDISALSISDTEQYTNPISNSTFNSIFNSISTSSSNKDDLNLNTNKISSKRLASKTRKKREELSTSAVRSIKKEDIKVTVSFT